MNTLLKWNKGAPIEIEHSKNPFLSLQHEVDRAFRDFYDFLTPAAGQGRSKTEACSPW